MQFSQLNITQMQLKITHWTQRNSLRLWQLISKFIITMKRELREFLWIDRATRIVVVSMFKIITALANGAKDKIYLVNFNPNKVKGATHLNRWTSPSTMPTSTSSVWASSSLSYISTVTKYLSFNTVKLLRYVNGSDHLVLGFEIVFFLFVVYYLVEEILEIKKVMQEQKNMMYNQFLGSRDISFH